MQDGIDRVRSFDRTITASIGALEARFLGRDRPLGESRVLWEIGDEGADVRELRLRLGLDAGYLSRLLRSLEGQGLVSTSPGQPDARLRRVSLTAAGVLERAELDRLSDEQARSLLASLGDDDRARLVASMADVERLVLRARTVIAPEPATSPDVQWCFGRYFAELGRRFEGGFDVTRSNRADASDLTPPSGLVLLARLGEDPVGCGAIKLPADGVAEIKRMWVAPRARGLGLGSRLLRELEGRAAAMGATVARLETNRALVEAIAMYRRTGYREVPAFNGEPYADHWFEKPLTLVDG